jgi:hypothetical protein
MRKLLVIFAILVFLVACSGDSTNATVKEGAKLYTNTTLSQEAGVVWESDRVAVVGRQGELCSIEYEGRQGWLQCKSISFDRGVEFPITPKLTATVKRIKAPTAVPEPSPTAYINRGTRRALEAQGVSQPSSGSSTTGSNVLVRQSGTSDTVTDTFTLSQPCGKFVIEWTAKATGSVPFINFRVYDITITDYSVERSGPHQFEGEGSGKPGFLLSAGSYYIQVEGNNIRWSIEARCES